MICLQVSDTESAVSMATNLKHPRSTNGSREREEQKPRPYQLELLDACITENTIVNLGTGAGKTFIAVMLIREFSYEILSPFYEEDAKRTVFLVNTVPLVKQQAEYISAHSLLEVGKYTGDMKVDGWSKERWLMEFNQHHVLVMTRAILKDLLHRGFIHLKQVNLLIFDECHHAVKNDDYVQIMRVFDSCSEEQHPRVLGLSASLLPSKCKPGELEGRVRDLEATLRCRAETARDLKEVSQYATNPHEEIQHYRSSSSDPHFSELRQILEGPVNFLNSFTKLQKTTVYEKVKLYLDDCLHILENLGIWCAHDFAKDGLKELEQQIENGFGLEESWETSLLYLGVTHLKVFKQKSEEKLQRIYTDPMPVTNKVSQLLIYLGDSGISSGETDVKSDADPKNDSSTEKPIRKLLGIIFVQRRTTAALLTKLLRHKIRREPDLRYLKCDYIVGHNEGKSGTYLRKEAHMKVKKQNEVLEKFRKEKINLLVATSVVEEGVDVPRCNLVIRFDFPQNFRSYIQSKGRARAKESIYLVFIERESSPRSLSDLRDYQILEKELQKLCHDRHIPEEEEILQKMEDIVPPYMPHGREAGTRATLATSLSLVHKYCQKLPSDRYTVLTPVFKTKSRPVSSMVGEALITQGQKFWYRSVAALPMSCPIKEDVEVGQLGVQTDDCMVIAISKYHLLSVLLHIKGDWMPTRHTAEMSAALESVKRLHAVGELNEHLLPVSKAVDSEGEEEGEEEREGEGEDGVVFVAKGSHSSGAPETEKGTQDYPNEVASPLASCFPVVGQGNHLYAFLIREAKSERIYQSLPDRGAVHHTTLGILTSKPMAHLRIPEFSLYDGKKELYVTVHKLHTAINLSKSEVDTLRRCHKALFTAVLRINWSWLETTFEDAETSYVVVPVGVLPELEPMEMFLEMDMVSRVVEVGSNPECQNKPLDWPCSLELFQDALVTGIYGKPNDRRLHEVIRVDGNTTPTSRFPDPARAATFGEYFKKKYRCELEDLKQPSLECKPVGISASRLRLVTSRYKTTHGEDLEKSTAHRNEPIRLFPQCCSLYPLPASFWKLVRCLPSILWRLECVFLVNTFRVAVATTAGIGMSCDGTEITTSTNLRGYEDHGFGHLKTQSFSTNDKGEEETRFLDSPDFSTLTKRGPDNALLLEALTPKAAKDSINLERLETLGDSFLKLSTSVHLFCDRPNASEGQLSAARARRVGNFSLFSLTKQKGITEKILSRSFDPTQMWVPPCFSFNENDPNLSQHPLCSTPPPSDELSTSHMERQLSEVRKLYHSHRVTDKGVADCVESLLGAYLVSGGIEAGLKFMKWVGIKCLPLLKDDSLEAIHHGGSDSALATNSPKQVTSSGGSHSDAGSVPLFVRRSSEIFIQHFGPAPSALLNPSKEGEIERLLSTSMCSHKPNQIRQTIEWKFSVPAFFLQALTHASYMRNRATDCYQQLEFLGDAVLDYLVTAYIYSTFPKFGPGEISGMRSALVNNVTFAELAVQLNLDKALLHNSPELFRKIPDFVEALKLQKARKLAKQSHEKNGGATITEKNVLSQSGVDCSPATTIITPLERDDDEECVSDDDPGELDPPKPLGDVLESLAGAIFLDSRMSLEAVWKVFQPLFEAKIKEFDGEVPISPIQELFGLELGARAKGYRSTQGKACCTITVECLGLEVTEEASSHKAAKTAAARAMLRKLRTLDAMK